MSETEAPIRKMIRARQLAELLGVHRTTIYDWVERGEFPAPVNVGDHAVAFYMDEVAEWQRQRDAASQRLAGLKDLKPRVGFRPPRPRK